MFAFVERVDVSEYNNYIVSVDLFRLDVENNPNMALEDVIFIQDQLIKNKQDYDNERYM